MDPDITELPAAAKAPEIVKSVQGTADGKTVIRMFWRAPTEDVEGEALTAAEISGYQINIAKYNSDGTTGTAHKLADTYTAAADADGLIYYDIPIESVDYPIELGTKYAVTITAWRNFRSSSGASAQVPGASNAPWLIMQNLNVDTDGDWAANLYPDADGDGIEDVVAGTLVTITANITAGGSDADPEIQLIDEAGAVLEPEGDPSYDADSGLLTVEYRLMSATGTYTVRACKPGCTGFVIEEVPLGPGLTGLHLNDFNGDEEIVLYAGDINEDGFVDAMDMAIVKSGLNRAGTLENGDVSGDGFVDAMDMSLVKSSLNKSSQVIQWTQEGGS